MGLPSVTGELLLAVAPVGGLQTVGAGFTTTLTVAVAVQVPDDVIVTVYVPVMATVAEAMVGFCAVEL
jgi:hypothetical protein